jgi:ribosomal RNA assembly protein
MQEEVKIPKERIAVLIGEKGNDKRRIQRRTNTKIIISSKEGDVLIEGEDSLNVVIARDIVRAIGRGFNPDIALALSNEENSFELLNIQDFVGKAKNQNIRIKSRLIGTNGKCRRSIENLTGTSIVVFGKTVGIIGTIEGVSLARRAIEKLITGSPHNKVYKWIEIQKPREAT